MLWNEDQSPRVKKGRKHTLRVKWESVFSGRHTDNVPMETHVVSVMTQWPLETVALVRHEKDDRLLPHPIRGQSRMTVKKVTEKKSSDKRSQILCRCRNCKNPSCKFWHPPVCQNYTSLKKDVFLATNVISDMLRQKESPAKGQRKVVQRTSCDVEGVHATGLCISRLFSKKVYST